MNEKLKGILGTGKRKVAVITAGSVLVLSLGTVTTYAATVLSHSQQIQMEQGVSSINVAPSMDAVGGEVMNIIKDGVHEYSTDGGQTWNTDLPKGFTLDADGRLQKIK